jgi:hypothetical protein|tara:strand:- start:137 stop:298 length:162 start_codon:yes stop_codon:yes gene_type:complete
LYRFLSVWQHFSTFFAPKLIKQDEIPYDLSNPENMPIIAISLLVKEKPNSIKI